METGPIDVDDNANELPENLGATDRPLNEPLERDLLKLKHILHS
jgi:hypothetical protein